jgi:hypothetical protein
MKADKLVLSIIQDVLTKIPRSIREAIVPDMLIPKIVNNQSKVQLSRLAHIHFEHPDLDQFEDFAEDFGFVVAKKEADKIYYRGYGKDPYVYVAGKATVGKPLFKGPAIVAASREELDKAKALPGAVLHSLTDAPGGGKMITFSRVNDTFFHVVFGQEERIVDPEHVLSTTFEELGPANTPFKSLAKANSKGSAMGQLWCTNLATLAMFIPISTRSQNGTPTTSTLSLRIFRITGTSPTSTS